MWLRFLVAILLFGAGHSPSSAYAISNPEDELAAAGVVYHKGERINLALPFTDSEGNAVTLQDYFKDPIPVVLVPAYYHCPRLCGLLLSGLAELIGKTDLRLGQDYRVVTVSFDPNETAATAKERAEFYRSKQGIVGDGAKSWEFLVGPQSSIAALMAQVGFGYKADSNEFIHSAVLILLTPQGEISQYLAGIAFEPKTFRLALVDAARGRIGSVIDQVLLFCFRYDHLQGRYTLAVFNVVRLVGLSTLAFLAVLIVGLRRRELRRRALGAAKAS